MDEVRENIENYLKKHKWMALGTVSPDGNPLVHEMGYASEGVTIYLATDRNTRKVQDIENNSRVAYTVGEDYDDPRLIQGVQMEGVATLLSNSVEVDRAINLLTEKFPFFSEMANNSDVVFIKIDTKRGLFHDSTKGFGHTDMVEY